MSFSTRPRIRTGRTRQSSNGWRTGRGADKELRHGHLVRGAAMTRRQAPGRRRHLAQDCGRAAPRRLSPVACSLTKNYSSPMTTITRHDPLRYLGDELDTLKTQGLYRHLRILEDEQRAHTTVDGRSVVNLSSNNYLGLTTHPRLRERRSRRCSSSAWAPARCAPSPARWRSTWSSSAGSPSSRTPRPSSCSRAASPRTRAPCRPSSTRDDVVISDELNHASIIDGCRLSRAAIKVFPHKDVDAARSDPAGPAARRSASC